MQDQHASRELTVDHPRAAAVFVQSHLRRILLQFAGRARSMAEVALALQMTLKRLHPLVLRLHRLGLLEVAEVRPRAGRAVRLYRTTAERFYIPARAVSASYSRGLVNELQLALARDAALAVDGMQFWLDDQGRVSGRFVERPGAGFAPLDSWRILRLSAARAAELKQELGKVLDAFQALSEEEGQVYLVHAALARRHDHEGASDSAPAPD